MGFTRHLIDELCLSVHTISSMPFIDRPADSAACFVHWDAVASLLPEIIGLIPPGALIPSAPATAHPKLSHSSSSSSRNGKGRDGAGPSSETSGQAGSSNSNSGSKEQVGSVTTGRARKATGGPQPNPADQHRGETYPGAPVGDRGNKKPDLCAMVGLWGLAHGCWGAIQRGHQAAVCTGATIKGRPG
jgi:hypothetical protein